MTYHSVHSALDIGHMLTWNYLAMLNKYGPRLATDISHDQLNCGTRFVNGQNNPITLAHNYNFKIKEQKHPKKHLIFFLLNHSFSIQHLIVFNYSTKF